MASNLLIEAGSSFSLSTLFVLRPALGDNAGGEGEEAEDNGVSTELDTEEGGGNTAPGNTKLSYGPECLL